MNKEHSVHVFSLEHLVNNVFIEIKVKEIAQVERVLQANDVGPESTFEFSQEILRKPGKLKSIVATSIGGDDGVPSGPGNHGKTVASERRKCLRLDVVYGIIEGVDSNAPGLTQSKVHQLVVREKGGGVGMGDPGAGFKAVGLVHQNRLLGLRSNLNESPSVRKTLQVCENDLGPGILDEVVQQVVFRPHQACCRWT